MIRALPIVALLLAAGPAAAQQLDLSRGGPIAITASDGIEWRQAEQQVVARGNAQAVRGGVTVTADRLTAWYRKKPGASPATQAPGTGQAPGASQAPAQASGTAPTAGFGGETDTAGNEIYRVQADGNVHIFTHTDQAWGDRATYDMDQAVLVMTGRNLKLTTPTDVLTARDDLEYWAQKHMAVARGDAVVQTSDARRLAADTLVAYTTDAPPPPGGATSASTKASAADDPLGSSGKLQKVEAYGHVSVRTPTDMVTGDRAIYVPETGIARIGGTVRITRGQNQLNGSEAEVNMKTGVSRLLSSSTGRVQGLMVPNDKTNPQLGSELPGSSPAPGTASPGTASPGTHAPGTPAGGGSRK
jgi:lipopolysaccharide export system protein LptA